MRHRLQLTSLALALALGGGLGVVAADQGGLETTTAAWTDQVVAAAPVTAGTWKTVTPNTCITYGQNGERLAGCQLSSTSSYHGWGVPGKQTRNYYLKFDVPNGTRRISFDVDLSSVTGNGTTWSWEKAAVLSRNTQFAPRDGWTCGEFPRVRGTGVDWQVPEIFFQVQEDGTGASTMCR